MANHKVDNSTDPLHSSRFVLPIFRSLYHYSPAALRADLFAGATVALVSIPQTIGFALIIGISPQVVIYAAIVGVFFTALFSSSRHLVTGPTTTISIILASTVLVLEPTGYDPLQIVVTLAFLIGLIQIGAGLIKVGVLNRFISRSVIIGYTTGVCLLIAAGQLNNLLGLRREEGPDLFSILQNLVVRAGEINPWTAGIGVASLALLFVMGRWLPRWPGGLLALIIFGGISAWFDLGRQAVITVGDIGEVLPSLPTFQGAPFPHDMFSLIPLLMSPAFAIAILGMLETVSLSKAVATSSGQKINPNQEILGLGVGNIMSSLFGAIPGSASFARTASNFQSGARTQCAAVFSSLFVAAIVLIFGPWANHIPVATLAALLIFICSRMINPEQIAIAVKSTRSDAAVFFVTFLSALFLSLDTAIYIGIAASLVLFLKKAASPQLVEYAFNERGDLSEVGDSVKRHNNQISIIHVEGELFFGAAEIFQDQIRYIAQDEGIRVFILRLKNARHVDATSIVSLQQLLEFLNKSKRHLLISGINDDVERVLRNSGFLAKIGKENVFRTELNPTMSTKRALLRASHLLQTGEADIRIFYDRSKTGEKGTGPKASEGPVDYQI